MTSNKLLSEFAKYTSLNILGMIALSCYILADTYFISAGIGADGLAALNIAVPIYSFIHGSGLMIGIGGGTRFSVFKSRGDNESATNAFNVSILLGVIFSVFFVLIGIFFSGGIISVLGADESIFEMAHTYLLVLMLFSPAFIFNNILQCFLRNDGAPQLSMAAMISGSLLNVVMDWIFIFPCQMGIFGAVLATGMAPLVGISVSLTRIIAKKTSLSVKSCRLSFKSVTATLSTGAPSLVTELSSGVVMIVFNYLTMGLLGNTGVAAYSVVANLSLVVMAVYTGIAQGIQPIISRNYGMGNYKGVNTVMRYAIILMLALSAAVYAGIFFGADAITAAFNSQGDAMLQSIAPLGLQLYFIACPFAGFNIIAVMCFTSMQLPRPAHIISLSRGFVIIISAALIFSWLWKINGTWLSFPAAELITSAIAVILTAVTYKKARLR